MTYILSIYLSIIFFSCVISTCLFSSLLFSSLLFSSLLFSSLLFSSLLLFTPVGKAKFIITRPVSKNSNLNQPILSYPILSYPILSYPILSYPILSYPILSYASLTLISFHPSSLREAASPSSTFLNQLASSRCRQTPKLHGDYPRYHRKIQGKL